jgi:hypothetical protein
VNRIRRTEYTYHRFAQRCGDVHRAGVIRYGHVRALN